MMTRSAIWVFAGLCLLGVRAQSDAQISSPVYVDDSPRTVDALSRSAELAGAGNLMEAAGILEDLLRLDSERVVARRDDADLFVTVRTRVHEVLLANPGLLTQYRARAHAAATNLLEQGAHRAAERSSLLTTPGFDAAVRVAQEQLEHAQFDAALLTIAQLDTHPDRKGEREKRATTLGGLILSYLDPEDSGAHHDAARVVRAWGVGGLGAAERPAAQHGAGMTDVWGGVPHEGLLARPLWQEYFGLERSGRRYSISDDDLIPAGTHDLDVWPTVLGEDVFINDGQTVSAWNRFTLSRRWSAVLPDLRGISKEIGASSGEANQVAAADGWVVALSSERPVRSRDKAKRSLHGIDALTGRVVWSRRIEDFADPSLERADFAGPVVIDQGVAVVGATKNISERRLDSTHALGIDLRTGQLLWARLFASSGKLPWNNGSPQHGLTTVRDGIAYRVDRVGVISSFETVSGRVRWARRVQPEMIRSGRGDQQPAWIGQAPILHGGYVIALSPDGLQILVLNAASGRGVRAFPASLLGAPDYLLLMGDTLLGVGDTAVFGILADDLVAGRKTEEWLVVGLNGEGPGIRGRVVVAGNDLLVPVRDGFALVSVARGEEVAPRRIALDRPGNILPVGAQLIAVDDRYVHSYLVWESAERLLRGQMESDADDPSPAVTYAELAYRAGRGDSIVSAADAALAAIERDPLDPGNEQSRARLFRALLSMVSPEASSGADVRLGDGVREQVIERLELAASAPIEQVHYLMTAADFYAASDRAGRAVDAYQRVLLSDALAKSSYTMDKHSVLAEEAASDRLRDVVRAFGKEVYQTYEDEARWQLEALNGSRDAAAFEHVARRYPVSSAAALAVLEAASVYERQGRPNRAVRVLERGLESMESGWLHDEGVRLELEGRIVRQMERGGRAREASNRLAGLLEDEPGVVLTEHGESIDALALLETLNSSLEAALDRPDIGPVLTSRVDIPGWQIHQPEDPTGRMPSDSVFMRSVEGEIALWRIRENGLLREAWGGIHNEILLRVDGEYAYTLRIIGREPKRDQVVVKRSMEGGREIWASPRLVEQLQIQIRVGQSIDAIAGEMERIAARTMLYVFDSRTLAVVGRRGQAVGLDLLSGRILWQQQRVLREVADIASRSGVLAVGGVEHAPALAGPGGAVLTLDIRTGEQISRQRTDARVVWVEANLSGSMLCGVEGGLVSIDPFRAQTVWQHDFEEGVTSDPLLTMPGYVLVKDNHSRLWQVFPDRTDEPMREVDAHGRLVGVRGPVAIEDLGSHIMLGTLQGIVLIDHKGQTLGIDIRNSLGEIVPAAVGQDLIVTLDASAEPENNIGNAGKQFTGVYTVRMYSTDSCRLESTALVELGRPNTFMHLALTDGKILVTTGTMTTVIDAPITP